MQLNSVISTRAGLLKQKKAVKIKISENEGMPPVNTLYPI
jgi:hypothetical protein